MHDFSKQRFIINHYFVNWTHCEKNVANFRIIYGKSEACSVFKYMLCSLAKLYI